jgi:hypothetical protein
MSNFAEYMGSLASGTTITLLTIANCAPCEKVKPSFALIGASLGTMADFHELDVRELSSEYLTSIQVRTLPTILFHNNGILEHKVDSASDDFKNLGIAVTSYIDGCMVEEESNIASANNASN